MTTKCDIRLLSKARENQRRDIQSKSTMLMSRNVDAEGTQYSVLTDTSVILLVKERMTSGENTFINCVA